MAGPGLVRLELVLCRTRIWSIFPVDERERHQRALSRALPPSDTVGTPADATDPEAAVDPLDAGLDADDVDKLDAVDDRDAVVVHLGLSTGLWFHVGRGGPGHSAGQGKRAASGRPTRTGVIRRRRSVIGRGMG